VAPLWVVSWQGHVGGGRSAGEYRSGCLASKLVHCGRGLAATRKNSCPSQDGGGGVYF